MKTLKYSDLKFKNETLEKAIELLFSKGFNVYTSLGSHKKPDEPISYIYYEEGENIAYLQAERFYGIKYSTVHNSERGSGFGTGFGMCEDALIDFDIDELRKGFCFAPNWAKGDLSRIKKYKGIEDYLSRPINKILEMHQIIK